MINGLEGIPGSGKSYEAVVYHVLEALRKGRKVVTNLPLVVPMFAAIDPRYAELIEVRRKPSPIRGTWDPERVDENGNGNAFELFEDGHTVPADVKVSVFGHVWDYYTTWKHEDGSGPLFVIDECHVALPTIGTSEAVIQWYKLHRHFNVDVLLMTQSFRDINQPIARLMGVLVKCRKADILGKADHYIRKVHGGYRGAVISTEQRKYLPQYFPLYKSHTQGNGVAEKAASDVAPFIVKFNRFKNAFLVVTLAACVYAFWPAEKAKPKPKADMPTPQWLIDEQKRRAANPPEFPPQDEGKASSQADKPAQAQAGAQLDDVDPEPFKDQRIHITGWMTMAGRTVHTFAVSAGGLHIFDLRDFDLAKAGYKWQPLGECSGMLRWRDKVRAITCDPPVMLSGSENKPVVIADGSRRSSRDP